MAWILPLASSHRFGGIDAPVRILRGLGGGSQGQVFEVAVGEEALALKWYFPTFLRRDPGLAERLAESIRRGSPNGDFLWPLALLRPTGAEAATLTIMAGGSEADFQRARPVFQACGKNITHLGPSGSGQVTKLANQLIVAQTIDAVAQALRLAELSGVDPALVRKALLGGFAESRILDLHGDRMVRRDFAPGGRATLQLKDVRLMCQLADSVGLDSPTLRNSLAQWEKFVHEKNLGDLDHSGLFRLYEA